MSATQRNRASPFYANDALSGQVGQLFESVAFRSPQEPSLGTIVTFDDPGVPDPLPYPESSNAGATLAGITKLSLVGDMSDLKSSTYIPVALNPGSTETTWLNSSDGHLYRGPVDLEAGNMISDSVGTTTAGLLTAFTGTDGITVQKLDGITADFNGSLFIDNTLSVDFIEDFGIGGIDISSVLLKDSSIELVPAAANPSVGTAANTLWIDSGDNKLKRGTISLEGSGGGISGPVSSVVNHISVFDNITGDLLADSDVKLTCNTTNSLGLGNNLSNIGGLGSQNLCLGDFAGDALTSQDDNTFVGFNTGKVCIASDNTVLGSNSYLNATGSAFNLVLGASCGNSIVGTNNIIIGYAVTGGTESGVTRIGNDASATSTFIAGIYQQSPSSAEYVSIGSDGEMGSVVSTDIRNDYTTVNVLPGATPYAVQNSDFIIKVDTSSNAMVVNLPLATNKRNIRILDISGDASTNNITINGNGGQLIIGAASLILSTDFSSVSLWSNITHWYIA